LKTAVLLCIFAPILLFGEVHWTQELPGGFRAAIHLPKTRISIDENLTIHLTLKYPPTHAPDLDSVRLNLLKYIGVTDPPFALKDEEVENINEGMLGITFYLEPQLANSHFVSFYDIPFIPVDEDADEVKIIFSDILTIDVYLPEIDSAYQGRSVGLLSLTDPLPIGLSIDNELRIDSPDRIQEEKARSVSIVRHRSIPWTQIIGVLLFCMVLFIARMQPKRKPDPAHLQKKQAAGARSKALEALSTLDSSNKEEFYVELTNTVRRYIEEKFQIRTTTQTTQEFLYSMSGHPSFDRETQAMLSDFLVSSDRVKFADRNPSEEECKEARQTAEQFIQQH